MNQHPLSAGDACPNECWVGFAGDPHPLEQVEGEPGLLHCQLCECVWDERGWQEEAR